MRGRGSDQGGRWPVGIWFALVGMSAGTVASFALVGWTFARSLDGGVDSAPPMEFESGTVIIEAEEPPEGAAGGDEAGLEGRVDPGSGPVIDPSPPVPQTERLPEADPQEPSDSRGQAETEEPQLIPVGDEEADDAEHGEDEGLDLHLELEAPEPISLRLQD